MHADKQKWPVHSSVKRIRVLFWQMTIKVPYSLKCHYLKCSNLVLVFPSVLRYAYVILQVWHKTLFYWFYQRYGHMISMVSCQKGPTRHAYAWQIGPFWQDTLDIIYNE